ncbi:MAG: hypothetical protein LCH91_23415 [Bacteroidetes bacterium]|nr:hypothetical protein [Bacteroidota bacterium]
MPIKLTFSTNQLSKYNFDKIQFDDVQKEYFTQLLEILKESNLLSDKIDEIIMTDSIESDIERYCKNRQIKPSITKTREFRAIGKTIDFDGIKKVFFDIIHVNSYEKWTPQIIFEQLIDIYAEDIIEINYNVPKQYTINASLTEIFKIHLQSWMSKIISNVLKKRINYERETIHSDVKNYTNSFKRNIRKLHYSYQKDKDLAFLWFNVVKELNYFVLRCLDVKFDNGSFDSLQEFHVTVPNLLNQIDTQADKAISNEEIEIYEVKNIIKDILKICYIDIQSESPINIKIIDTPKKLFKGNIVDTEPRIVAFIDILGFSAIIEEYDSDETSNILNDLHETLELAIKISIDNVLDQKVQTDLKEFLEYRMFSDCICISLPFIEFENDFHIQFHSMALVVKSYQLAMMQKGFFVRGGISMGNFYSDRNMIFSGGLVKAYKIETLANYPIVVIDNKVLERLKDNFIENTEDLFFDGMLVFSKNNSSKIFLNPFDILDNSKKNIEYLQNIFEKLIKENLDGFDNTPLTHLTHSFLKLSQSITNPLLEEAKNQMSDKNVMKVKDEILHYITKQIKKHELLIENNIENFELVSVYKKIIEKYYFLKDLIEWTKRENDFFEYYNF